MLEHLRLVAANQRTARQAVRECLDRCSELDGELHAWVQLDREGALAQADRLDARRAAGEPAGPLFGVPVGIKDLFDVAGWPTGCGSPRLEAGPPVMTDAALVARLRGAGAVILGKTVTTQFACFDPPPTRNPWNLDRTPGGSSSGSAVAVATGMCLAALGSQTGGSITRPAAFCGITGFKPSFEALPLDGVYPVAGSLDHPGPLARSMADLQWLAAVLSMPTPSADLDASRLAVTPPRRIGILRGPFADHATTDCRRVFDETLKTLGRAGVEARECPLPELFGTVIARHRTVMIAEIAAQHEARFAAHRADYLPGMSSLIEEGLRVSAMEYVRAKRHQRDLIAALRELFREFDLLACPSARGGAPTPETTGDPSFNAPWSYTGLPTVTLPMGRDGDGLPLGLQLVGVRGADRTLLAQGRWCEEVLAQAAAG